MEAERAEAPVIDRSRAVAAREEAVTEERDAFSSTWSQITVDLHFVCKFFWISTAKCPADCVLTCLLLDLSV